MSYTADEAGIPLLSWRETQMLRKTFIQRTWGLVVAAIFACTSSGAQAIVVYVDDDAPPGGDGLTWNTAFRFLQDAMVFSNVLENNVTEIRIAQGVYKADHDEAHPEGTGDTNVAFEPPSVPILGGFAGFGAPDPDLRHVEEFRTVLSGDLAEDDMDNFVNYNDNSRYI